VTPETLRRLVNDEAASSSAAARDERTRQQAPGPTPGPLLFARYAYAPNSLGYCGPRDSRSLLDYGVAGAATAADRGLREQAQQFAGAWPYLELIAGATGISDPLDGRVVEAYWLGSDLLEQVDFRTFGASLLERFRRRAGKGWGFLAEAVPVGAQPNHSFHVFGVYPWVGLLGGERRDAPLHVLEKCRIRWGQVVAVDGDQVIVMSRPLEFDGRRLSLGANRLETVERAVDGSGFVDGLAAGDWVAMHWHWVCDRLSRRQLANLRRHTYRQLQISNERVSHPGPAMAMG
jgi:hypothetical protein